MDNLTYDEFINNILETRGRFACGDKYHERHHIIPKCMGGTNDEDNLIDLFAKEHFIAHRLLALENSDNSSLVYAWACMAFASNDKEQRYELSPEEYEEARMSFSEAISGENNHMFGRTGEQHPAFGRHIEKEKHPWYGRHHTEESKEKMRDSAKNRWTDERRQEVSDRQKEKFSNPENHPCFGKHKSDETKEKISKAHQGKISPNKGITMSEEQKQKISKSKTGKYCGEENPRARQVIRLSDKKIYGYLNGAAEDNNMCRTAMRKLCKLKTDFMYYDEWLACQND
jgi:hypothetical protein